MTLSRDLSPLLEGWDYDPQRIKARWVTGADGHAMLQLRIDMGLLQMQPAARPDGTTPCGYESLVEYYEALEQEVPPDDPALQLNDQACSELQQEAVQYYYRYLAFYALGNLEGVARDTDHNLRLFRLVAHYGLDDDLVWQFLQFFPYVRMMHARAVSDDALDHRNFQAALEAVDQAVADILAFWSEYGDEEDEADCEELALLEETRERIRERRPKTRSERLREDMALAIRSEDYEQAAVLRDKLKALQQTAGSDD